MLDFPNSPSVNDTFSPSGTGTTYKWDGVKWVPAGISMANPSSQIGLTANNGSATTAMRSDAAPALSQAITPTWTGTHVFNNNVGINQASPTFPLVIQSNKSQLKLTDGTHSGYLRSGGSEEVTLTAGAYYDGTNWIATDTTALAINFTSVGVQTYNSPGQTIGNPVV